MKNYKISFDTNAYYTPLALEKFQKQLQELIGSLCEKTYPGTNYLVFNVKECAFNKKELTEFLKSAFTNYAGNFKIKVNDLV